MSSTLRGFVPTVAVLGLRMPDMDGAQFLGVVRSYLRWQYLPVVVVTAYAEGPEAESVRQLGAKAVFEKSAFQLSDLVACVARLCDDPDAACASA